MKPVAFDYARPRSIGAAVNLLAGRGDAKLLAGAQTLGPMLNLRLVQPGLLIDITRIPELVTARDAGGSVNYGACVTHAAIEDGRAPDPTGGYLASVASGIAYRAVRTRGTIGGSLAHADPAADWLSALLVLRAELTITGPGGSRRAALADFVRGAMETDLAPAEMITAVEISRPPASMRLGFHKICRKTGEFADAIGAVAVDEANGDFLMVCGGASATPVLFDDPAILCAGGEPSAQNLDLETAMAALRAAGHEDDLYDLQIHAVAMKRALADAAAP